MPLDGSEKRELFGGRTVQEVIDQWCVNCRSYSLKEGVCPCGHVVGDIRNCACENCVRYREWLGGRDPSEIVFVGCCGTCHK